MDMAATNLVEDAGASECIVTLLFKYVDVVFSGLLITRFLCPRKGAEQCDVS